MGLRRPSLEELKMLRMLASLQFRGLGELLIPDDIYIEVAKTGKVRKIMLSNKKIYMSLRAPDHRYVLHLEAGRVLWRATYLPMFRVIVDDAYKEFIVRGGNVFTKHVVFADPYIRPFDEVIVVDKNDKLLAVGRALHPGWLMNSLNRGEAVKVRETIGEEK